MIRIIVYGLRYGDVAAPFKPFSHDFSCKKFTNPHHDKRLRQLTGFDKPVIDELKSSGFFGQLIDQIERKVGDLTVSQTIGLHCTGGRHRSVVVALELWRRWRARGIEVEMKFLTPISAERWKAFR